MQKEEIITIKNLFKYYGKIKAVDGISFVVYRNEIFGLVGPNGAGKTTTIECIEGLRKADSGQIRALGMDPGLISRDYRRKIGIQLQHSELPARIKVWEALDLFSSFYDKKIDWKNLLSGLSLEDKSNAFFSKLSGGQKQRLFIALALINDPELVFLDELTTGLDPQARRATWDLIRNIRNRGKTIFLTTHYMEEAEQLCDRVGIMDHGKIIALDTPQNLKRNIKIENSLFFSTQDTFNTDILKNIRSVTKIEKSGENIIIYGRDNTMVMDVVTYLVKNNINFRDLRTQQPTLEDVFLAMTGKEVRS
ncbi:MAG: ABC transporter ATP-binding protein [Actinobacteria bacterium]|nr:ABC transporter ATP-binding protein [Actinomycetota bacterium]